MKHVTIKFLLIKGEVRARSELQRREQCVTEAAQILSGNESLLNLIRKCLHNTSQRRPLAREIVRQLTAEGEYPEITTELAKDDPADMSE